MTNPASPWQNRIVRHSDEPPNTLLANPANWRRHPDAQQRALLGSLGEVGWVADVIANRETGHLLDGHLRVELAIARHEGSVPVTWVDLSEEEERFILATLDPIAAMAEAESDVLRSLLDEIETGDEALASLLADLRDTTGPQPLQDDPDDLPAIADSADVYVERGQLWLLGDHRLLCGDATAAADVGRLLDGIAPTLLATDPPYGVSLDPTWRDRSYNRHGPGETPYLVEEAPPAAVRGRRKLRADADPGRRRAGHRNVRVSNDTRADWSEAYALVPSLEVGYVWHADVHTAEVLAGLRNIGLEPVCQVIWDKELFAMGRSWYHWQHEPCWVVRRRDRPVPFLGARNQATIWRARSPKMIMAGSVEAKQDHPAQKPALLFELPIRNHLRAGEWAYDPFLGSGTALVAAETQGRRCAGMELEPRYVQQTIERWQALTGGVARVAD